MGAIPIELRIDSVPFDTMTQALRLARSSERFECESLFPKMIQAAEDENLPHAATELAQMIDVYAPRWELFDNAVGHLENTPQVNYWIHPACEYIVTSDTTGQSPMFSTNKSEH